MTKKERKYNIMLMNVIVDDWCEIFFDAAALLFADRRNTSWRNEQQKE
jgi:hypothetical protein